MLEGAQFVAAFESNEHVYMVAREAPAPRDCQRASSSVDRISIESNHRIRDESMRARVMRVCKSDKGAGATTHNYRNQNKWTSFIKVAPAGAPAAHLLQVRLNCSLPGDYPFYFDQVAALSRPVGGVYFRAPQVPASVVYAVVNTPYSGIRGAIS